MTYSMQKITPADNLGSSKFAPRPQAPHHLHMNNVVLHAILATTPRGVLFSPLQTIVGLVRLWCLK